MSNKQNSVHEPLFHITKRSNNALSTGMSWVVRIAAVLAALIVCGVVTVLLTGEDPLAVYSTMIKGAFGSERKIWALAQNTAILLCISLAVTPAFKMKFWNIGAEGQVLMGGLATTACMILFSDKMPTWLFYPVMIIVSLLAGAIWGLIPAFFKAQWNTNETLFTLMMNYVSIYLIQYFIKMADKSGSNTVDPRLLVHGHLPILFGQKYLLNIILVAIITVVMHIYLKYTKHGYEISVVGESPNTAKYIGINVKKVIIRTMAISGAVSAFTGLLLVGGTSYAISVNTAGGRGFTAIMVSWMSKFNPAMMTLTTFLIIFLSRGAEEVSTKFGLNSSFSDILTGIILFFLIGCEFFINYHVKVNLPTKNKIVKEEQ